MASDFFTADPVFWRSSEFVPSKFSLSGTSVDDDPRTNSPLDWRMVSAPHYILRGCKRIDKIIAVTQSHVTQPHVSEMTTEVASETRFWDHLTVARVADLLDRPIQMDRPIP
jgi:hypothetical protein